MHLIAASLCLLTLLSGCEDAGPKALQRMVDQTRCEPDGVSQFFRNGSCNQQLPAGAVAFRSEPPTPWSTGLDEAGAPLAHIPVRPDRALLAEGRKRFELICATCHGLLGDGQSEVAENMQFRRPPALFEPRIRALPDGQIFRVISEGYGLMPSYARTLPVAQRWAVVAYVRALAISQSTELAALPEKQREEARRWLR